MRLNRKVISIPRQNINPLLYLKGGEVICLSDVVCLKDSPNIGFTYVLQI